MARVILFIIVFGALASHAESLHLTAEDIKGVSVSANLNQCKIPLLDELKGLDSFIADIRLQITNGANLDDMLSQLLESRVSLINTIQAFMNTTIASASVEFPEGMSADGRIETNLGFVEVRAGVPISNVTFVGLNLCEYLDLDSDPVVVSKKSVVEFLNSLFLN